MRIKQFIPILLLMILGGVSGASAQTYVVNLGDQVTEESAVVDNELYAFYNPRNNKWMYEDSSNKLLLYGGLSFDGLDGSTMTNSVFRLISNGDGTYKIQAYYTGRYLPAPTGNGNISTSETAGNYALNIQSDGNMFPRCTNNGTTYGLDHTSDGVYAFMNLNTNNGSAQNYRLYKVSLSEYVEPEGISVVTLNNTNSYRGALIYNPSASTKWVWSSGKSGTFNSSDVNSQWVLYPTGTDGQYYLYNLGAKKFAIPVTGGTYPGYSWAFSSDAAALTLNQQADGTYKLKTASGNLCVSVSNNYEGPIINYDDIGAQFTLTKLSEISDAQTQELEAAIGKLIHKTTPLSAVPSEDGWYAIRIKTNATYPDYFVFAPEEEINYNGTSYALNFYNAAKVRPAIDNAAYYFRIAKDGNGYDWQMPNGRYLYNNSNKFPVSTETATAIAIDHSDSGFRFSHNSRYAVPYYLSSIYFIGETSSSGNAYYDIYPISLANAGLTAWQVICDDAPASVQITCSRTDVSGLTSVYKNGYFFLPSSVTPEASDFFLPGGASTTVDATTHTITIAYNPDLAIVEEGVTVEQGWQTAARGEEVMLLRITAAPFNYPTGVSMSVNLKDGAESNISKLTLYEASSASPEILSTGTGAPTKTVVSEATIDGSTATFTINNFSAVTHYYWVGATITEGAELGAVVDAAVTGITYTYNSKETTLDLASVGDPSDRGAMVFNVRSYPFLPRDNGSRVYRIPALVTASDGSLVAAADKRYDSYTDIGGGHVIDIVVRRSTDGGKTWGEPVIVAKGQGTADNAKCGYGDPSLTKGKDGKLYCLFAAGNTGYFYGLNRICMSTSEDNGVTWTEPVDLFETNRITDYTQYGLYDYFVTSGKGLYTNDGILMYLLPAQCYTDANKTAHINNSNDYLFYSTDDGATWHIDATPVYTGGDEAKLEQLADGTLIASVRQAGNRGFNTGTYTKNTDGTVTFNWGTQTTNTMLYQPYANNQDIFNYDREKGILFHTMTKGQHANLNLYMSTDNGSNWKHVCQLQPKGARYATMTKLENGDLGILFEDQSLNAAGGYTDYNHYPINFLTIAKEQVEAWIEVEEDMKNAVMIADGTKTNGPATYGDANSGTINSNPQLTSVWTSNSTSGVAGLKLVADHDAFLHESAYSAFNCLGIKPSEGGATDVVTITAPEGYLVKGYYMEAGFWTDKENYTITATDGEGVKEYTTSAAPANGTMALNVTNIYKQSTTFSVQSLQTANTRCLMINKFYVVLTKNYPVALNAVGEASYATLYLPFDVKTDDATKAYYVETVADGVATLTELSEGKIPAKTAVVLINNSKETSVTFGVENGLAAAIGEAANLLKGTLVPMELDLSQESPNYSMGRKDGNIGFYKFDNNGSTTISLGANKAYLQVPAAESSAKGFTFSFGDPSGITLFGDESASDAFLQGGEHVYDLVGGKKVAVK